MYKCLYFYNYNIMRYCDKRIPYRKIENGIAQTSDVSIDNNNVHLVTDSQNYYGVPKNLRKSSDSINTQNNSDLNISGLNTLNISGSQQFTEYNLALIMNSIGTSLPITVIDLRQESHGFINGTPVSWANSKNNANIGLTLDQVLLNEYNKLNSIKLNVPITFYNHKDLTMVPTKVEDEDHLVNSRSLSYIRIPVTDGKIPLDDMVNYFVQVVTLQPKNTWIHFHCKQGIGRTTTFMIMYDMIKNSDQVTADDIINRQLLLANFDENHIKSFHTKERANFLQNFYKYCKENSNELH